MRKQKANKPDVAVFVRFASQLERDYVNAGVDAVKTALQKSAPGAAFSFQSFAHAALMKAACTELGGVTFEDWSRKQR